jgi:hypothetical protein
MKMRTCGQEKVDLARSRLESPRTDECLSSELGTVSDCAETASDTPLQLFEEGTKEDQQRDNQRDANIIQVRIAVRTTDTGAGAI